MKKIAVKVSGTTVFEITDEQYEQMLNEDVWIDEIVPDFWEKADMNTEIADIKVIEGC